MIPEHLAPVVSIGSIVRIPLSGRRVRGWVVSTDEAVDDGLKEIASISGTVPVFDRALLSALEWAAQHYVAPLSVILSHASPPNLPRSAGAARSVPDIGPISHPILEVAILAALGKRQAARAVVGSWTGLEWLGAVSPVLQSGKTAAIVTATAAEAGLIADAAARMGLPAVVVAGGTDAEVTAAWEEAQGPGKLVIGTPRITAWKMAGLAMVIVLEEGRRAMKERQTPTIHVRELIRKRALLEGLATVFFGPTPSVEVLAAGAETTHVGNRAWPLVEVVDRTDDPPGSGFLSERVVAALKATSEAGGRAFVFTHRRIGSASMRCTRCRAVRTCRRCGTRVGRVERCPRCSARTGVCTSCGGAEFEEMGTVPERLVAEINSRVSGKPALAYPTEGRIMVGTERDLAGLPPVELAVAADADGMLMGAGYRASEEALRQLARLANSLASGSGRRMMVQTSHPESDLISTLRRGDPVPYLEEVLVERARAGVPPSTEMIVVELRDGPGADLAAELGGDARFDVVGPADIEGGQRWLLQGDLSRARGPLRRVVAKLREAGSTVRVDADPIDL